jgi:hypothetical protein
MFYKTYVNFFKYFFRVLHEASTSWLKLFRVFRLHPVHQDFWVILCGGWIFGVKLNSDRLRISNEVLHKTG